MSNKDTCVKCSIPIFEDDVLCDSCLSTRIYRANLVRKHIEDLEIPEDIRPKFFCNIFDTFDRNLDCRLRDGFELINLSYGDSLAALA